MANAVLALERAVLVHGPARPVVVDRAVRRARAARVDQEQADQEAHDTGDHENYACGLDREAGHRDIDCKGEDRAHGDQEYRCANRHVDYVPGTVCTKRSRAPKAVSAIGARVRRSEDSRRPRTDSGRRAGAGRAAGGRRVRQQEADRYRKAADDALQQLAWAIGYLHGIRKVQIARALARNRADIRRELMKCDEQPVPTGNQSDLRPGTRGLSSERHCADTQFAGRNAPSRSRTCGLLLRREALYRRGNRVPTRKSLQIGVLERDTRGRDGPRAAGCCSHSVPASEASGATAPLLGLRRTGPAFTRLG
jgi:hypothetical protein